MDSDDELQTILIEQSHELSASKTFESDLDLAFQLQMQEALHTSSFALHQHSPPPSTPPQFQFPDDDGSDLVAQELAAEEIARFERERSDREQAEAETQRMRDDLGRRIHDQAFAIDLSRIDDDEWAESGQSVVRPYYGEGSSSGAAGEALLRLYFKGVVREGTARGKTTASAAGVGIAICDVRDDRVFEMRRPLVCGGGGGDMSTEMAEVTGKSIPRQGNIATLVSQVTLLQRKFSYCSPSLVRQKDIKFALELAYEALVSQVTRPEVNTSNGNTKETCSICLEDTNSGKMFAIKGCLHRYCCSCMKSHVHVKLVQGMLPKCPHDGCKTDLTTGMCKTFLTTELYDIMCHRVKESSIAAADKIYCPYPRCSALMSRIEVSVNTRVGGPCRCKRCQGLFCLYCKVPWHNNMTCGAYKRSNPSLSAEDAKLKSLARKNMWRQCVKCSHMVELTEGCNHVTCRCKRHSKPPPLSTTPPPPTKHLLSSSFRTTTSASPASSPKTSRERSDRKHAEAETLRMRDDLGRRIHDQAFARDLSRIPDPVWAKTGDQFVRPYGQGSSSSSSSCSAAVLNAEPLRLYFKGLLREETARVKTTSAGVGIAICDMRDDRVLEMRKPLVCGGDIVSPEAVEVKALILGLEAAVSLGIKRLTVFCADSSLHQYVTGKLIPRQGNIATLVGQVTLLQRKFSYCGQVLVRQNDIKFALKLANEALVSQVTWPEAISSSENIKETCAICLEDRNSCKMFAINGCLHRYCYSCMKSHVHVKLVQGMLPKCPHEGCNTDLTTEMCKTFLTPELYDIMCQRVKESSIAATDKIYCPYPTCSALMSRIEVSANTRVGGPCRCKRCQGLFCLYCKVPWHNNMSCGTYKRSNPSPSAEDAKLKSLARKNLWRQCVKCSHMVELTEDAVISFATSAEPSGGIRKQHVHVLSGMSSISYTSVIDSDKDWDDMGSWNTLTLIQIPTKSA
ncbi:hypothetical protein RHGRI_036486 [Rhododendron griersonianum]|uniref:RBR-type E3 ubiquitin transferase n=1 Tax=Rhododendron griersonianum TaxID=479676 RepID=A0AAV6HS69_9ERIC|nr:hypothetical protein RHGRI_036486 [Rhododendron griersonianum]